MQPQPDDTTGVPDPFRLLEDPAIGPSWAADRTQQSRQWLDTLPGRDVVRRWINRLYHPEYRSPPTARRTGLFRMRLLPGESHPSLVFSGDPATGGEAVEQVLVDPDDYGPRGRSYLTAWQVCPEGRWLAFQVCEDGAEYGDLWLRDLAGEASPRTWVPALRRPSLAWLAGPDGCTLGAYLGRWSAVDGLAPGLWYCPLQGRSTLVWEPPGADSPRAQRASSGGATTWYLTPSVTPDGRWLLISARYGADIRNQLWLAATPPADPTSVAPTCVVKRGQAPTLARIGPDGQVYVAGDDVVGPGAVASFSPYEPERQHWRILAPERPGTSVSSFAIARGWVALARSAGTAQELGLVTTSGGDVRPVPMPGTGGTLANLIADPRQPRFWFEYSDHVRPRTVYCVEAETVTVSRMSDPSIDDPDLPEVRSVVESYRSEDGTEVDITVLARVDRQRRGVPTVLTAYGGFGRRASVAFRSDVLVWVLAGGAYALAQVRGGGEKGAAWHEAGRGRNKPAAVADLIAAGRHLIDGGWTAPGRLAVFGASNGGLLATAAAVLRPELFAACVANAPVTDLVRSVHLGDGASWLAEYGDPNDPDELATILRYSPYHNVHPAIAYPALLLTCGGGDVRVPAVHSYKLCAAVAAATASDPDERPVLLVEDEHAGHGIRTVSARIDAFVDRITFLARQLDLPLATLERL